jgi:hypothetical protein
VTAVGDDDVVSGFELPSPSSLCTVRMLRNAGANNGILLVLVAALAVSHVCAIEEVPFTSLNPAQRNQVLMFPLCASSRSTTERGKWMRWVMC